MSETFSCPNCTASLEHDGQDHLTVQCPYCSTTVIVPEQLRPSAYRQNYEPLLAHEQDLHHIVQLINQGKWGEATALFQQSYGLDKDEAADAVTRLASGLTMATNRINTNLAPVDQKPRAAAPLKATLSKAAPQPKPRKRRGAGCFIFVMLLLAAVGGALYTITANFSDSEISQAIADLTTENGEFDLEALATLAPSEEMEQLLDLEAGASAPSIPILVETGERGIEPGQLNFPIGVTTNAAGQIFIADRETRRIQRFTPNGQIEESWQIPDEHFIQDIELSAAGQLYVLQQSDIFRYDSLTGQQLDQIVYQGDIIVSYNGMALSADGNLYAVNGPRDYIIHFGPDGQAIGIIARAEDVPNAQGFEDIAVDDVGNLYVTGTADDELGDRQDVVFKFDPSGAYLSHFGRSGSELGQFFGIIGAIAVDNRGYIYISDFHGVQVFNNDGLFLDVVQVQGYAESLTINNNELIVTTNEHKLYVFDISNVGQNK